MKELSKHILKAAQTLADQANAEAIFLYADALPDINICKELSKSRKLFLLSKDSSLLEDFGDIPCKIIRMPAFNLTRMDQVKLGIMLAVFDGHLSMTGKIVCVSGLPKLRTIDTIIVLDMKRENEFMSAVEPMVFSQDIKPEIFETLLNIAIEISGRGKEGKPVGTIFVLGDHQAVMSFSRQMIINPFEGHPESERNILNPKMKSTIIEFSSIDGAFIIKGDGVLLAAGRHLNAAYNGDNLPQGLGSRHAAAAAITGVTSAIAIAVSETLGTITIFQGGKLCMEIEKPMP